MNRTYNFIEISRSTSLRASTGRTDLLKLTGLTDLRPSTVHIGLLKLTERTGLKELTERIGSLKLKEHIYLLGFARGQRSTNINMASRFAKISIH